MRKLDLFSAFTMVQLFTGYNLVPVRQRPAPTERLPLSKKHKTVHKPSFSAAGNFQCLYCSDKGEDWRGRGDSDEA